MSTTILEMMTRCVPKLTAHGVPGIYCELSRSETQKNKTDLFNQNKMEKSRKYYPEP